MRKCGLKIPTDSLICSAQEQVIRTPFCRMCGDGGETVTHIVSECSKLDNVARMVHLKLCEKLNLKKSEKCYLHNPETVTENANYKLVWNMHIQYDNVTVERRPDIVIENKMEKTAITIDAAKTGEKRITVKEREKIEKH